jgi:hypothetical protein
VTFFPFFIFCFVFLPMKKTSRHNIPIAAK